MRSAPPADQSVKVSRAAEICSVSQNEMKLSPVRLGERSLIMILHSFHSVPSTFSSTHGFFTLIQLKHTHTRTPPNPNPHTYVHMHLWSDVEYVNRHLLQHPISSSHHVSDMLMQPTEGFFLPLSLSLSLHISPSSRLPSCFLSSAPTYPGLPTRADEAEEGRRERGEEELHTKPDNDVVMDGCYTHKQACEQRRGAGHIREQWWGNPAEGGWVWEEGQSSILLRYSTAAAVLRRNEQEARFAAAMAARSTPYV